MRVDLGGGAWADLRDPKEVPERLVRPVRRAMRALSEVGAKELDRCAGTDEEPALSDGDVEALWTLNDLLAVALISEWSYQEPITVESVTDRPRPVYEKLIAAAAPHVQAMMLDTSPSTDPKAGTATSAG